MSSSEHARPFLTFHVGQAGVQIGHAIWELLCLEHNIDPDGNAKPECQGNGLYDSMFLRNASGHFMPRSILVDTDPTCIDEVRVGPYRELFSATQLLSDYCDTGSNYMRGRHGFKNRLVPDTLERFRGLLEKTETTPGVFLVHSIGGGTGSGLAATCLEALHGEFGSSMQVIEMNVTSGRTGLQSTCEIINQVLYLYESRDFTDVSFAVTNSAMYNVCRSGLNITNATYAHLNRILAMCFSNITAMERFPGTIPCTVGSICSNVRPFKHLKNLVLACAPFLTNDLLSKERLNTIGVASSVMDADSQLADVDLRQGRHMAGVLLFRGAAKPTDVEQAVNALRGKNKVEFVDWAPPSFKTGLIELPPLAVPSSGIGSIPLSVTLVSNHTSIASLFRGQTDAIRRLSPGGYFLRNYEASTGGGGVSSGHNSGIANLLREACDHMDSIVKDCESQRPPHFQPQVQQEAEEEKEASSEDSRSTGSKHAKQVGGQVSVKKVASEESKSSENKAIKIGADGVATTQDPKPETSEVRRPSNETPPSVKQSTLRGGGSLSIPKSQSTLDGEVTTISEPGGLQTQNPTLDEPCSVQTNQQTALPPTYELNQRSSKQKVYEDDDEGEFGTDDSSRITLDQKQAPYRSTPETTSEVTPEPAISNKEQRGSSKKNGGGSGGCCKKSGGGGGGSSSSGGCCKKSGGGGSGAGSGGSSGGSSGGCCKKRDTSQQKGGKKRSKSQNQANSELLDRYGSANTESESFRSANCADIECFRSRSRAQSVQSFRHHLEDFFSVSTRSTDSVAELSDIIQDCFPCEPLQTSRTICTVRQIIQKYNQIFTQGTSVAPPAAMTTANVPRAFK